MARVTVEDCVTRVPNRFELVMLAGQRARDISAGAPLTMDRDNDKNPVVALREIADVTVDFDHLRNEMVQSLQKVVENDEPEEDEADVLAAGEMAQELDVVAMMGDEDLPVIDEPLFEDEADLSEDL